MKLNEAIRPLIDPLSVGKIFPKFLQLLEILLNPLMTIRHGKKY